MCARTLQKEKNKTKEDQIWRSKKSRSIRKKSSIRKVLRERGGEAKTGDK